MRCRSKTNKHQWKRRLIWAASFLILASGLLALLVFRRVYFSNQDYPRLARLQWNHSAASAPLPDRPLFIGHRGAAMASTTNDLLIGNTGSAIQLAIDAGAEWIEIDIRRSSDGHLVVFHDETIDLKTTGVGKVAALTLDQLQAVEVLTDPAERILTLNEVFETYHAGDRKWILDIKARGIRDQLLEWIEHKIPKDQIILFGRFDILQEYASSDYAMGYTAISQHSTDRLKMILAPSSLIQRCELLDCDYLVLPVGHASRSLVASATERHIEVWVYGTDDESDIRHLTGSGVRGFIIDRPQSTIPLFASDGVEPTPDVDH